MEKYKCNLNKKDLLDCIRIYEKTTRKYFLPCEVPEQNMWMLAFQEAKNYFLQGEKNRSVAPVDNGIKELDLICQKFNNKEINLNQLVCKIWNTALTIGQDEGN
ncbi:MAG: hypothetical protein ACE5R3_05435 [Nitrosopumilaceae archaeon]